MRCAVDEDDAGEGQAYDGARRTCGTLETVSDGRPMNCKPDCLLGRRLAELTATRAMDSSRAPHRAIIRTVMSGTTWVTSQHEAQSSILETID
jgi:hypothetical protein